MTIRQRFAIRGQGTLFHLPSYNGGVTVTPAIQQGYDWVPFRGLVPQQPRNEGWNIAIDVAGDHASIAAALEYRRQLWAMLFNEFGQLPVDLCRWHDDDGGAATEIFRNCYAEGGFNVEPDSRFDSLQRIRIQMRSITPGVFASFSDGTFPAAGPWETYIAGADPGGVVPVPIQQSMQTSFTLPGVLAAADADTAGYMQQVLAAPTGAGPSQYRVRGIRITGAVIGGGAGTSSIVVSNQPWDDSGNEVVVSLAAADSAGATIGTGFVVAAGAPVYVYCRSAAGNHAHVMGNIEIVSA